MERPRLKGLASSRKTRSKSKRPARLYNKAGGGKNHLKVIFERHLAEHGLQPEMEYQFHPRRKWRFDYAFPDLKIAVEIEGGIWTYGRHNRPATFIADCEKYAEAAILGWLLVRIPTDWIYCRRRENREGIQYLLRAIETKTNPSENHHG